MITYEEYKVNLQLLSNYRDSMQIGDLSEYDEEHLAKITLEMEEYEQVFGLSRPHARKATKEELEELIEIKELFSGD